MSGSLDDHQIEVVDTSDLVLMLKVTYKGGIEIKRRTDRAQTAEMLRDIARRVEEGE